ncbi:MAG: methylenetetrahydrofolate reductase C-terminal domain-containing protein [Candidatus Omnitrophica bacterium]|nr:methylenetetrahydrofolate reductase C-terminal domain-containing protein [Candidatus Omnitrophota bacterium]MBU4590218.1 methylenetetrahydrofolate reductase C-terminal domain-containing protein [Candidatus Omnitrophota bacterium]
MIVSQKKEFKDILEAIGPVKKIFIIGCGECATTCKTGGEKEVLEMKKLLEDKEKVVTGWTIPDAPCIASQVKMHFAKNKKSMDEAEAFLVLACGLGAQSVLDNDRAKRSVYTGCDTLFGSVLDMTGLVMSERCAMCGECVLNITGGICPVTRCAKGLLNGPCGGSDKGKCEVDKDKDCAWILIYNRLKELNMLDNIKKTRPPKDYSKLNKPREVRLEKQG